jgi:hypothetical protein
VRGVIKLLLLTIALAAASAMIWSRAAGGLA